MGRGAIPKTPLNRCPESRRNARLHPIRSAVQKSLVFSMDRLHSADRCDARQRCLPLLLPPLGRPVGEHCGGPSPVCVHFGYALNRRALSRGRRPSIKGVGRDPNPGRATRKWVGALRKLRSIRAARIRGPQSDSARSPRIAVVEVTVVIRSGLARLRGSRSLRPDAATDDLLTEAKP
jgi:hypothetical protein